MTPEERLAIVETQVRSIADRLDHIDEQIDKLVGWANRWRGGFAVILGVGALLGWFADKIFAFIGTIHK